MLRRTVFSISDGDELWLQSLRKAGFSSRDVQAIYDTVIEYASWDIDAEGNLIQGSSRGYELSAKVAQHWFVNTWISQEGINGVFTINNGCMAGTPLADLMFSVSISAFKF